MNKFLLLIGCALGSFGILAGAKFLANACTPEPVTPTAAPLPDACTFTEMSPAERQKHGQRLSVLGQAAKLVERRNDSFTMEVDLKLMPRTEVEAWVEKEQKCCGFLSIRPGLAADEGKMRIDVQVAVEQQDQVIAAFGLK